MLSVDDAKKVTLEGASFVERTIQLPLEQSLNYVLAQNINAERDYPPFDRMMMDGVALNSAAVKAGNSDFAISDMAQAGKPQASLNADDNCIEVATGAPLPLHCDTVIPYEETKITNKKVRLTATDKIRSGRFIHPQGADVKKGALVLAAGSTIGVNEITVLAANGVANPLVYKKPSIAVVSTGDELVNLDVEIADHQIRRSNDISLKSALLVRGFTDVHCYHCDDELDDINQVLSQALKSHDVILIAGGVSKGAYDFIPKVLQKLKVNEIFHRVAQRPGRPLWFGKHSEGQVVFGLPGNPVSCLTCLLVYVVPLLNKMSRLAAAYYPHVELAVDHEFNPPLTCFCPVIFDCQANKATPISHHGSGDFTSLLKTDGFIELPANTNHFKAGQHFRYYSWN